MDYYQKLAIIIVSIIVVVALGLIVVLLTKRRNHKMEEEFPLLLEAFGGKENINEYTQKGSRVSVVVENKKLVDKEKVKEQGIETIVVSNKKFTILVGSKKAILVYNYLKKEINS